MARKIYMPGRGWVITDEPGYQAAVATGTVLREADPQSGRIIGEATPNFGRPRSRRGAENYMKAVATGAMSATSLSASQNLFNQKALADTAMRLGSKVLSGIPGAAEVMNWLDIAGEIPVIGDLTDQISDIAEGLIGEGIGLIGDIAGGVIDTVESIPVVGDVVGVVGDVLEEIPLIGSLF